MRPITVFFRINLDRFLLGIGRVLYKLTLHHFPRKMFSCTTEKVKLKTDVRIISEDEDGVTIAKTYSDGSIADAPFTVLSTTDLHLGDDPALRKKSFQMLKNHIVKTHPDLIVFTGDIILSKFQHIDCLEFAQMMEEIGIYWAICFGNHEAREEKGFFKYLLMKIASSFPHCLARFGDENLHGYGNYYINILNGENSLLQTLFFFDSGRDITDETRKKYNLPDDMNGYDFLKKEQLEKYSSVLASNREKYGGAPSMMYMHIPIKEYEKVITGGRDENKQFIFSDECEVKYGKAFETIGSSPYNSGMFDLILKEGSTHAIFSGHDHVNDFCALYKGVFLVYNQCCGYETYKLDEINGAPESEWPLGVTVTEIGRDGKIRISSRLNSFFLKDKQDKQEIKK